MRSQKLISAGFAIIALASASIPAVAYTVWPEIRFDWYDNASVGTTYATAPLVVRDRDGNIVTRSRDYRDPATR